jgi:Uma2 family endonuclease
MLVLDMAVSSREKRKITYEEWLDFPTEEGVRTELIDGEVLVAPEPTVRHQRICVRLLYIFETFLRQHGGGEILPPVNVRLADDQGFGPDLVFVREWGDDPLTYHGPPPLVIEVVSDARRDLRIKRDRYERYGVPEYWAVLPGAEQVQIFRLVEGRYAPPSVHEQPGTISPLAIPSLMIDLAEVFAD